MKLQILLATLLVTAAACQDSPTKPEASPATGIEARLKFIEAQTPSESSVVRLLGQVEVPSNAQWILGPSVDARLVGWSVTTGSRVAVGDTLATLVSPELGDLASVANELSRVVREREKNVGRLKESVDAGFKSSASLHEAELSLSESKAQLQRVQRQLGVRNANIRRGQKSEWEWVSPVDGVVSAIECAPGGLYSGESRCITIVANDAARLRVDVSESLVAQLGDRVPAAAWTPDGAESSTHLEFERRSSGFHPKSRTQAYYFNGAAMTVGASGTVELTLPVAPGTVAVPRMAVVEVQGVPTVFVERADELPKAVPVKVVGRRGEDKLITGIQAGDRVVSRGAFALKSVLAFE